MNIAKALPADTITGSDHGTTINTNCRSGPTDNKSHGTGVFMTYIETLLTLLRWKNSGWEVHPINLDDEFTGWV